MLLIFMEFELKADYHRFKLERYCCSH